VGKEAKQTNYVCLNLFAFGPTQIEPPAFISANTIVVLSDKFENKIFVK
jgi:hypothetical protein